MSAPLTTPLCRMFNIKHPVLSAGMASAAGPELVAAVTNAGGLGVLGGVGFTPKFLRSQIAEIKEHLHDKNAPFGIDLLLPQVGGSARKTNRDYTNGQLPELLDIVIEEKAALFVCAVGVPPTWAVEKLHKAGIPVANMIGSTKHIPKALAAGVDLIFAQGGEGGGHTGDISTTILIPACAEALKGKTSPLTGQPVLLVAAGGIYNGKGLAAALAAGATGVWVGTRFVCAEEAGASRQHQEAVISAGHNDTIRTIIYTGRPMRVRKTPFILSWEDHRQEEIRRLASQGTIAVGYDCEPEYRPFLMGSVSAVIQSVEPAKKIVEDMVREAAQVLQQANSYVNPQARL